MKRERSSAVSPSLPTAAMKRKRSSSVSPRVPAPSASSSVAAAMKRKWSSSSSPRVPTASSSSSSAAAAMKRRRLSSPPVTNRAAGSPTLAVILLRRGHGRGAGGVRPEPRRRRGQRSGRRLEAGAHAHGAGGDAPAVPVHGGGGDAPPGGRAQVDEPLQGPQVAGHDPETLPGELDKGYKFIFDSDDVARWRGIVEKKYLLEEDTDDMYQPYIASYEGQQEGEENDRELQETVSGLNKELGFTYSAMLDTYIDIYKAVAEKWKIKRNLNTLPWERVRDEVQNLERQKLGLLETYKAAEKHSIELINTIYDLSAQPLQRPPLLKRHPTQLDAKKERRGEMKQQKKEEKKITKKVNKEEMRRIDKELKKSKKEIKKSENEIKKFKEKKPKKEKKKRSKDSGKKRPKVPQE